MMEFRGTTWGGALAALSVMVLGACGSDASTTAAATPTTSSSSTTAAETTTSTTSVAETMPPAKVTVEEFAPLLRVSLEDLNSGLQETSVFYVERVTGGSDRIELEVDVARMVVEFVDTAVANLPEGPDDESLAELYDEMESALRRWGEVAGTTADALDTSKDELVAGWDSEQSAEQFNAIFELLPLAHTAFEQACLDLAEPVLELTEVALDCLGLPEPVAQGTSGMLGGIEVVVDEGAGLVLEQQSENRVTIAAADDDEFSFSISRNPSFADPTRDLDLLRVEGGTDWPDDMEEWITSIGAVVESTGQAMVGGFSADYWDVSITDENAVEVSGGHPAVAVVGLGGDGSDTLQFQGAALIRLYRITIDPSNSLLAVTGGVNPDYPGAADLPPFVPTAAEAFDWLDASLPAIGLY